MPSGFGRIDLMKLRVLLGIILAAVTLATLQGCVGYAQTDVPSSAAPSR